MEAIATKPAPKTEGINWESVFPRKQGEVSRKATKLFEINGAEFYRINLIKNDNTIGRSFFVMVKGNRVEDITASAPVKRFSIWDSK